MPLYKDPALLSELDRLQRRMQKPLEAGRVMAPVLNPQRVRGEQLMNAVSLCVEPFGFSPANAAATAMLNDFGNIKTRQTFATATRDATAYLWKRDLVLLADSMPLPRHVMSSELFPHDVMYWTLDSEIDIKNKTDAYSRVSVQAWLIIRTPAGYVFGAFSEGQATRETNATAALIVDVVPMGARYPDDIQSGLAPTLLKMAAFLNSPFVSVDRITDRMSKKARRRYGPRIGDPVALNVVTLRAEVHEAVRVERGEGPQWKQRWLVRGHYRAQWYPTLKSHKVIWVAPYIKGPDDAPFKQPIYSVVR